jgi:hypothetical protein
MSPKEQSQAAQLLHEWFVRMWPERDKMSPDERELLDRTDAFLRLEEHQPESHGDRRGST